jgi:hypothetical protein
VADTVGMGGAHSDNPSVSTTEAVDGTKCGTDEDLSHAHVNLLGYPDEDSDLIKDTSSWTGHSLYKQGASGTRQGW